MFKEVGMKKVVLFLCVFFIGTMTQAAPKEFYLQCSITFKEKDWKEATSTYVFRIDTKNQKIYTDYDRELNGFITKTSIHIKDSQEVTKKVQMITIYDINRVTGDLNGLWTLTDFKPKRVAVLSGKCIKINKRQI